MNFVTLFNMENMHITKDVGLIPYGMYKYFQYDSYCASYDNGPYTAIDTECKGLKMWFVKRNTRIYWIDALLFLMKYSKKIDILNVYHIGTSTAFHIIVYITMNHTGKVYWKMDGGAGAFKKLNAVKRSINKYAMRKCSLISAELEENKKLLKRNWGGVFIHIPNPYQPGRDMTFEAYENRVNTILTVGRLGTRQKATEILLDAFETAVHKYGLKGWWLKLIGSVEPDFQQKVAEWYGKYPDMKPLVSFAGVISDREQLYREYQQAKVFAFPSRHESYGISLLEAAINGCFIIATDIPSNCEITEQFQFAASFPVDDAEKLAEQLAKWCANETGMEENARKLYECVRKKNSLYEVCRTINEGIK